MMSTKILALAAATTTIIGKEDKDDIGKPSNNDYKRLPKKKSDQHTSYDFFRDDDAIINNWADDSKKLWVYKKSWRACLLTLLISHKYNKK